jgi:hypothetical protein
MNTSIRSSGVSFPLKNVLNFTVAVFAILAFFMGRN